MSSVCRVTLGETKADLRLRAVATGGRRAPSVLVASDASMPAARTRRGVGPLVALVLLLLWPAVGNAGTVVHDFPDFSDVSKLRFLGSTATPGGVLRFNGYRNQNGVAWVKCPIPFGPDASFQTRFRARIFGGWGVNGHDGFAFVMHNNALRTSAGNTKGFEGLAHSVAIEIDTTRASGDPNNNHISLMLNGNRRNHVAWGSPSFNLNSGATFWVWVDYNGSTNLLEVYASPGATRPATPLLTHTIDLSSILGTKAWIGFGGNADYYYNLHEVQEWHFASTSPVSVSDVCNGFDDDCDGLTDEDYAPETTCQTIGGQACTAKHCVGDFSAAANLERYGSATVNGGVMWLDAAGRYSQGGFWRKCPLPLDPNSSFRQHFRFRIRGGWGTNGGEGFALVFQNNARRKAINTWMGYSGLTPSLAIEFDTADNGPDPNNNHVAVMVNGNVNSHKAWAAAPADLNSGRPINAWIDYDGATDTLSIYVSEAEDKPATPTLTHIIDLYALLGDKAWIGMGGRSSYYYNRHEIEFWEMEHTAATPIADVCNGFDDDCDGQTDEDYAPDLACQAFAGQACTQKRCTSSFIGDTTLQLNGNATAPGLLRLNPAARYAQGSAFTKCPLPLDGATAFHTRFRFRMPGGWGTNGGEGMSFVVHNAETRSGTNAWMGYSGVPASVAVEFDTADNGPDPNANHIGVMVNGNPDSHSAWVTPPVDLNSGRPINAWIDYDGISGKLDVFVSEGEQKPAAPALSTVVDIAGIVGPKAYVGFGGRASYYYNAHDVEAWEFLYATPAKVVDLCNGVDDDCDGKTDEDYAPQATCQAIGGQACEISHCLTPASGFPGFALTGSANVGSKNLDLTPLSRYAQGSAWIKCPISIDDGTSFSTRFRYRIFGGYGGGGNQGLSFVLQNSTHRNTANAWLGYSGLEASVSVELDTADNGPDPNGNHVSINLNGATNTHLAWASPSFDLNDGQPHHVWIDYDGAADQLKVYIGSTENKPAAPIVQATVDLHAVLGDKAYLGFGASNGYYYNAHRVETWDLALTTNSAVADLCNGVDDDCDGTIDEDFVEAQTCVGANPKICTSGRCIGSFAGVSDFKANSQAGIVGSVMRLASSRYGKGSAWWSKAVPFDGATSFHTRFQMKIFGGYGGGGTEGMAFLVQSSPSGLAALGTAMGYQGVTPSVGVEFDTEHNPGDSNNNHIAVVQNGSVGHLASVVAPFDLNDGVVHNVWIDYDSALKRLDIYTGHADKKPDVPLLSYTVDISQIVGNFVHFGFTARNGYYYNAYNVQDWELTLDQADQVLERCNGFDDDLDGLTDEDFPTLGQACDGPDAETCKDGELVCSADGLGVTCADGPKVLLRFEAGLGSAAKDLSGEGNGATLYGSARRDPQGKHGGALLLPGNDVDSSVRIPGASIPGTSFTFAAWVNPTLSGYRYVVSRTSTQGDNAFLLGTAGDLYFEQRDYQLGFSLPLNTWTHVAVTYDGRKLSSYRDGALIRSSAVNLPEVRWVSDFWLGHDQDCHNGCFQAGQAFGGRIDDLVLYDHPMDAAGITALMAGIPDTDVGLELCGDKVDNDCNGSTDDADDDGDGFACAQDCDDADPSVHPGATDSCDGRDNDCNGTVDDGVANLGQACDGPDSDKCLNGTLSCAASLDSYLLFDGVDDGVQLPAGSFANLSEATVEGWIRFDSFDQSGSRFVDFGAKNSAFFVAHVGTTRRLAFQMFTTKGTRTIQSADGLLRRGRWHHVAATCGPGRMKLFLDGKLVGSHTTVDCFDDIGSQANNYVGRSNWGGGFLKGAVAGLRVSDVQRYLADFAPPAELVADAHTVGLWKLADGSGTQAKDSGPGALHGTLAGDPLWSQGAAPGMSCPETVVDILETCDGLDDDCSGKIDDLDLDGDGSYACLGDCNDADAAIFPGRAELCDTKDNNCDGKVDEGLPSIGSACDGPDADQCMNGTNTCAASTQTWLDLDGTSQYVELPVGIFENVSTATVEGYVRFDSFAQNWSRFLDFGAYNGAFVVAHRGISNGIQFSMNTTAGTFSIIADNVLTQGKWHHVAATCGPDGMKLFLDGKLLGTGNTTACLDDLLGYQSAYVGRSHWPGEGYLKGGVGAIRVSDTQKYLADFTPPKALLVEADTLHLWKFGEAGGTVVPDIGPRPAPGTVVGGTWKAFATAGATCVESVEDLAEVCNGIDDDCNGVPDDLDADGDGVSACGTDCDDTNPSIKPGVLDICDGLNNNCAGGIDEDAAAGGGSCLTGNRGACDPGTIQCDAQTRLRTFSSADDVYGWGRDGDAVVAWNLYQGMLRQTGNRPFAYYTVPYRAGGGAFTLEVDVQTWDDDDFGIVWNYQDTATHDRVSFSGGNSPSLGNEIISWTGSGPASTAVQWGTGDTLRVKLVLTGTYGEVFVGNLTRNTPSTRVLSGTVKPFDNGRIGFFANWNSDTRWDNLSLSSHGMICVQNATASAETCNLVDDDCDGVTDEDFTPFSAACGGIASHPKPSVYYGRAFSSRDTLQIMAMEDDTPVAVIERPSGAVLYRDVLKQWQRATVNVNSKRFKVEAGKPLFAFQGYDCCGLYGTFFYPSMQGQSRVGTEFRFFVPIRTSSAVFWVLAYQNADVVIYDRSGKAVANRSMTAGTTWAPPVSQQTPYRLVATGNVMLQSNAVNGYDVAPSSTGADVGSDFFFGTRGAYVVFAYDAGVRVVVKKSNGTVVMDRVMQKGDMAVKTSALEALRLTATGGRVSVWAGSFQGSPAITRIGDDLAYHQGIGGKEFILHSQNYGATVFASRDNTTVTWTDLATSVATNATLNGGDSLNIPTGKRFQVLSDQPVVVGTFGGGGGPDDYGQILRPVPPGAISKFLLETPSLTVQAGAPFDLTVAAVDDLGIPKAGYLGTATVTSSDALATLPAPYAFTPTDAGKHVFTGVVLQSAGAQVISASDVAPEPDLVGGITMNVIAGPPDLQASTFTAQPAALKADGASQAVLTLSLTDAFANPKAGVQVVFLSTHGSLLGSVVESAPGVYTQKILAPLTSGIATLQARVGGQVFTTLDLPFQPDLVGPPPVSLIVSKVTPDSVDLKWTAANAADLNGYRLAWSEVGSPLGTPKVYGPTVRSATVSALLPCTDYRFTVWPFDLVGNDGNPSPEAGVSTALAGAPAAPAGLTGQARESRVDLSWSASTSCDVKTYRVYRRILPGGTPSVLASGLTALTYADTAVVNGTTYGYTLRSFDSEGLESADSSELVGTPKVLPPPPALGGFVAKALPGGKVQLAWTPEPQAVQYLLYRATGSLNPASLPQPPIAKLSGAGFVDTPPGDAMWAYTVVWQPAVGKASLPAPPQVLRSDASPPTALFVMVPASPLGIGTVTVKLRPNEQLSATPTLKLVPPSGQGVDIPLTQSGADYAGTFAVDASTEEGTWNVVWTGVDLVGNQASGPPKVGGVFKVDRTAPKLSFHLVGVEPVGVGQVDLRIESDEALGGPPTLKVTLPSGVTHDVVMTGGPLSFSGLFSVPSNTPSGSAIVASTGSDLAGNGASLPSGSSFLVDTQPPGAPASIKVNPLSQGKLEVVWQPPAGESTLGMTYVLVRIQGSTGDPTTAPVLAGNLVKTTYLDPTPSTGLWSYAVRAVDGAGNKGPFSPLATGNADQTPPGPPTNLAVKVVGTDVSVTWNAPAGEPAKSFKIYRGVVSFAGSVAGKNPVLQNIQALSAIDQPASDNTYYYVVTALDAASNESGPSAEVSLSYDQGAPVVTITGSNDGQHHKTDVVLQVTITDQSLKTSTIQLDSAPYTPGTAVSAEGDHRLDVHAEDAYARVTDTSVAFVIDKTPPVVTITGVVAGQTYNTAPSAQVDVSDLHLADSYARLDGANYVSGTPITTDGNHTLAATATDKAGNSTNKSVSFVVDLPPGPVPSVKAVVDQDNGLVELSWAPSTEPDVVAYRIFRDGVMLTEGNLTSLDAGAPPPAPLRLELEVRAVDAAGQEGAPRKVVVYPVSLRLVGFGTPGSQGGSYLTRGYFDTVQLQIQNDDLQAQDFGPFTFRLADNDGIEWWTQTYASTYAADPVSTVPAQHVLYAHPELDPADNTMTVEMAMPAGGPGATASVRATFPVPMRFPNGTSIEPIHPPLIRGTKGIVQLKITNHGSAPLQLISAKKNQPSDELWVRLKKLDGTVIVERKVKDTFFGTPRPGGKHVMEIPPGVSFTLNPVEMVIPNTAPDMIQVEVEATTFHQGLDTPDHVQAKGLTGGHQTSVVPPEYFVTAATDKSEYLENEMVAISGVATFSATGLPAPLKIVKVVLSRGGFNETVYAKTDANGLYSYPYYVGTKAGAYSISATHPLVVAKELDATFVVHGLRFDPTIFNLSLSKNASYTVPITLRNTGDTQITGINATLTDLTPGSGVSASFAGGYPASLAAHASRTIRVKVMATLLSSNHAAFRIDLATAQGATRTSTINVKLFAATPSPSPSPGFLDVSMLSGTSLVRSVKFTNMGHGAWANVRLVLPQSKPWIRIPSGTTLGDFQPGESKTFDVLFQPPAGTPTGLHNATIWVESDNHAKLPYHLTAKVTSSNVGAVEVFVINLVYLQVEPDKPVPGATVVLQSQDLASLVFKGQTAPDGKILFSKVPVGRYNFRVEKKGFQTETSAIDTTENGTVVVDAAQTTALKVGLVETFVDVEWSVTPTTIQDEYEVEIKATYETKVPLPIVEVIPANQAFNLVPGMTVSGQVEVINLGLVSAWDVDLNEISRSHFVDVQWSVERIPELPAKSTMIIPFTVHLKPHASPAPLPCTSFDVFYKYLYVWICETAGGKPYTKITSDFSFNIQNNTARMKMSETTIVRKIFYNCPGFENGASVVPPGLTTTNLEGSDVEICDCGRMITAGIGLPKLSDLLDKLLGDITDKIDDLVGGVLQDLGVPSWADVTDLLGEGFFGPQEWADIKAAKDKLDQLQQDAADAAAKAKDMLASGYCKDQSAGDNLRLAVSRIAEEVADTVLNNILDKYTDGILSFKKSYTFFDKTCLPPGSSSTAEIPESDFSFGFGTMNFNVRKGCGSNNPCCPVGVGFVDYTAICLDFGISTSTGGTGGGGGPGWGGWGPGSGGSGSGGSGTTCTLTKKIPLP